MDFLVNIVIDIPTELPQAEQEALKLAERARANELAEQGTLVRLWRVPGRTANWGLWAAENVNGLDQALRTLPLHPYMSITIHPLALHPNDPASVT